MRRAFFGWTARWKTHGIPHGGRQGFRFSHLGIFSIAWEKRFVKSFGGKWILKCEKRSSDAKARQHAVGLVAYFASAESLDSFCSLASFGSASLRGLAEDRPTASSTGREKAMP